jgi:hypothetical protein
MDSPKKKKHRLKFIDNLMAYGLGFGSWLAGLHCLEADASGRIRISRVRFLRYLLKLFLWVLEISLVYQLLSGYCVWLLNATPSEKISAVIAKSVVFLYIKVFWPRVFPELLPGFHVFFCPQCYQKQTFLFRPVSFKFGFFVTYLCRHCFCLVNAWGEQIFYPLDVSFKKTIPSMMKMMPAILAVLAAGVVIFKYLWDVL